MRVDLEIELKNVDAATDKEKIFYTVTYRAINADNESLLVSMDKAHTMTIQNVIPDIATLADVHTDEAIKWADLQLAGSRLVASVGQKRRFPFGVV